MVTTKIPTKPATSGLMDSITRTKTCLECGVSFEATFPMFLIKTQHGSMYQNFMSDAGSLCNSCSDLDNARREQAIQEQRNAEELERRKQKWSKMCPPIFQETVTERLPGAARGHMDAIAHWQFGPRGLILAGPSGAGKTRLFWLLGDRLYVDERRSVVILTAAQFSHECQKAFFRGEGDTWVDRLVNAAVLMIDDLGKGRLTERTQCELFSIVNDRMAHKRPIIITMNHSGDSLAASMLDDIGWPMVRRLRESCQVLNFD